MHVGVTDSNTGWFSGPAAVPAAGAGVAVGPITGVGVASGAVVGVATVPVILLLDPETFSSP